MMRKIAIVLAAAALVTAGSASTASARFGGGGFGGGFHGGFHSSGFGGGFHSGGFGHSFGPGFHHFDHARFARFDHDRRFFGRRFGVFGVAYPYGYYDDGCYARVWTRWGWRWQYVCY